MNAISYIKNVGKSFGYAAWDVAKEMNPAIKSAVETNSDIAKEMFEAVKDFKGTTAKIKGQITSSAYWELGKEAVSNTFEDLKTGNWYNKERKDKVDEELLGNMMSGDDFDFDDSFDDFGDDGGEPDFGDDSDWDKINDMEDMMDTVGDKMTTGIAQATIKSSELIAETNKNIAKKNAMFTSAMFGKVNAGITAINANIAALLPIGEQLNTHIQNSTVFYTRMTELHEKQTELLEQIATNTAPLEKEKDDSKGKKTVMELLDSEGMLDIGQYIDSVKQNIKDMASSITMMGDMFSGDDGKPGGIFRSFIASPMEYVLQGLARNIIPRSTKELTESFNRNLSGFFSTLFMNMRKNSFEGGWKQKISEIFGISSNYKNTVNNANYEKGKVDFDGITRKAIIDVIPTYLSKILSAVSGKDETRFDYESGKYITRQEIIDQNNRILQGEARTASYDIAEKLEEFLKNQETPMMEEQKQEVRNMFQTFMQKSIQNGEGFNPRKPEENADSLGLEGEAGDIITEFLRGLLYDEKGKSRNSGFVTNLNHNILMARENITNKYNRMEKSGSSLGYLYDNAFARDAEGKFIQNTTSSNPLHFMNMYDDLHHNVFFYLQGIYQHTQGIFEDMGNIRGTGGPLPNNNESNVITVDPTGVAYIRNRALPTIPSGIDPNAETRQEQKHENMTGEEFNSFIQPLMSDPYYSKKVEEIITRYGEYVNIYNPEKRDSMVSEIQALLIEQREKNKAKLKKKGLFERLKESNSVNGKIKELIYSIDEIVEAPARALEKTVDSATVSMTNLLYGKEDGTEDQGFMGVLVAKTKEIFSNMNTWINDKILDPITTKLDIHSVGDLLKKTFGIFGVDIDDLKEKARSILFGGEDKKGILTGIKEYTVDNLKNAGSWVKKAYNNTWGTVRDFVTGEPKNTAADGGFVDKTGMVAVSEGEMIIPAEYNPFYNKAVNKAAQIRKENDVVNKFYGAFAKGKRAVGQDDVEEEKINTGTRKKQRGQKRRNRRSKNTKKATASSDDGEGGEATVTVELKDTEFGKYASSAFDALKKGVNTALFGGSYTDENGKEHTKKGLFGSGGESESKILDKIKDKSKGWMKEIGVPDNIGAMVSGGIIGLGASLLTGGVVSPLLAASLGAGAGLIIKSKTVQKSLFGTDDEEGILPKDVSNFIQKKLPKIAEFGAVGAITSLIPGIPGGPVAGLIVGSALGFATQNENFMNTIFGEKDKDGKRGGGLMSKELQDKIKTALPRMGAGAAVGLIAGPFGIAGNLIAGAALGFATTTDKFQDTIFGKEDTETGERSGGLIGWIREDLFDPIKNALQPMAQDLKNIFKGLGRKLERQLYKMFKETLGIPLSKKITEMLGPLGGLLGNLVKPLKTMISAPFRAIGWYGSKRRQSQIRKGTAEYMSAQERIKYRNANNMGRDEFAEFDEHLAGMTQDELDTLGSQLKNVRQQTKDQQKEATKALHAGTNALISGDNALTTKQASKIMTQIKKARTQEQLDDIKAYAKENFAGEQLQKINDMIDKQGVEFINKHKDLGKSESDFYDEISKKYGIKIDAKNADKYKDLINAEKKVKKKLSPEEEKALQDKNFQNTVEEHTSKIQDILSEIRDFVIHGKKKPETAEESTTTEETKNEVAIPTASEQAENATTEALKVNEKDEEKEAEARKGKTAFEKFITKILPNGKVAKYIRGKNGEISPDTGDKETREMIIEQEQTELSQRESAESLKTISGGFGNLLSNLFGKKDEEKEPTIFDKIKDFFGNAKSGFGSMLKAVVGPALFVAAFNGLFDGLINKVSSIFDHESGTSKKGQYTKSTQITGVDEDGNTVYIKADEDGNPVTDENGNYLDPEGNPIDGEVKDIKSETVGKTFSDRLKQSTLKGALTLGKRKTVAGKVFSKFTKPVKEVGQKAINALTDNAKIMSAVDNIHECLLKWSKKLSKLSWFQGAEDKLDDMAEAMTETIQKKLLKGGGAVEKVLGALSKFAWAAKIAFIVVDFTTGFQDARTTLGITADPTLGQKIMSGLIRTLKNLIPFIGDLIPDKTIVNLFIDFLAPALHIDVSELKGQQEQAKDEVAAYNLEHGTDLNIEEYNKQVKGHYTWTEKISNGIKSLNPFKKKTEEEKATKAAEKAETATEQALVVAEGSGFSAGASAIEEKENNSQIYTTINAIRENTNIDSYIKNKPKDIVSNTISDATNIVLRKTANHGVYDLINTMKNSLSKWADKLCTLKWFRNYRDKFDDLIDNLLGSILHKLKRNTGLAKNILKFTGGFSIASRIFTVISDFTTGFQDARTVLGITSNPTLGQKIISGLIRSIKNLIPFIGDLIPDTTLVDIIIDHIAPILKIDVSELKSQRQAAQAEVDKYNEEHGTNLDIQKYNKQVKGRYNWSEKIKNKINSINPFKKKQESAKGSGIEQLGSSTGVISTISKLGGSTTLNTGVDEIKDIKNMIAKLDEAMENGDLETILSMKASNPISNMVLSTYRQLVMPKAIVSSVSSKMANVFDKMSGTIKKDLNLFNQNSKDLDKKQENGDLDKIFDSSDTNFDKRNPLYPIFRIAGTISKVFNGLSGFVNIFKNPLKSVSDTIGSKVKSVWGKIKGFFSGLTGSDSSESAGGSGLSGGSSGFVSQLDSKYANKKLGNSNVADAGCGPAVATMALNAMGSSSNMNSAINSAQRYQDSNGTNANFFSDYYKKNGYDAVYNRSTEDIASSIGSSPTVLMGRDEFNTSKDNSPFGPKNHYVLAKGYDDAGNIIVDDPESNGTRTYSSSILNNVKLGISAGASKISRFARKKFTIFSGGASGAAGYNLETYTNTSSQYSNISGYAVLIPKTYNSTRSIPLIVFMHGDGETGSGLNRLVGDNFSGTKWLPQWLYSGELFENAIILVPQCASKDRGVTGLVRLVEDISKKYNINKNKISITGQSGGSIRALRAISSDPKLFSCAILMCGYNTSGANYDNISCPVIAITGSKDSSSLPSITTAVSSMLKKGKNVALYEVSGHTHNSICNLFKSYNLLGWLTGQSRGNGKSVDMGIHKINEGDPIYGVNSDVKSGTAGSVTVSNNTNKTFDTRKAIWDWLGEHGFNETARAGVMGCWEEESHNSTKRVEGDYLKSFPGTDKVLKSPSDAENYTLNTLFPAYDRSGVKINKDAYISNDGHYYPAIGLAQWTGPRTGNLIDFAKKKGGSWTSLGTQLDFFLNGQGEFGSRNLLGSMNGSSSIDQATKLFYNNYEGCTRQDWLRTRIQRAKDIYSLYTGSEPSTDSSVYDSEYMGADDSTYESSTTGTGGSKSISDVFSSFSSIISNLAGKIISSKFGKGAAALFGFSVDDESTSSDSESGDSTSNLYEDSSTTNTDTTSSVDGMSFSGKSPVDYMRSIMGTIKYSQKGPRNPDKKSADCSSTVQWAVKKATGGKVNVGTTSIDQAIGHPDVMDVVWDAGGKYASDVGHPDNLKENDLLFFDRGNTSRKYGIGHVSLYSGDGKHIHQPGPGLGPKENNVQWSKLVQVNRIKNLDSYTTEGGEESATGSGLPKSWNVLSNFDKARRNKPSKNSNHNELSASGSSTNSNIIKIANSTPKSSKQSAGASGNTIETITTKIKESGTSKEDMIVLIKAIVTLLENMNNNTTKINTIVELLTNYFNAKAKSGDNGGNKTTIVPMNTSSGNSSEVNKATEDLINYLNQIAAG